MNGYGKGKNGKDGEKRERMGTNDIFLESVGRKGKSWEILFRERVKRIGKNGIEWGGMRFSLE